MYKKIGISILCLMSAAVFGMEKKGITFDDTMTVDGTTVDQTGFVDVFTSTSVTHCK